MNQQERIGKILTCLDEKKQLSVGELCAMFGVSKDTARRDIIKLEQTGVVERFHGGIRAPYLKPRLKDYQARLIMNPDIKERLGRAAAALIRDNDAVMLDLSATVQFIGENITAKDVLAVTNSIDTAVSLMRTDVERIYLTGGYLHPGLRTLLGMGVLDRIRNFHFDVAFIGASAVRAEGLYYMLEDDVVLKENLMQVSDRVVLVADHTKYSASAPCRMDIRGVHLLVTDVYPPADIERALRENGADIMVVESEK